MVLEESKKNFENHVMKANDLKASKFLCSPNILDGFIIHQKTQRKCNLLFK